MALKALLAKLKPETAHERLPPPKQYARRSPHNAEKTGLKVGSTDPAYRPTDEASIRSAKSWFRAAG